MNVSRQSPKRKLFLWLGVPIAAQMVFGAVAVAAVLEPGRAQNSTLSIEAGSSRTVTLITGDRVVLDLANSRFVTLLRGKGRERMAFSTEYVFSNHDQSEHLYVIPHDALPLIASGKLDRQLFDVTKLLQFNYDDANRDDLPLIVTYTQESAQRTFAASASLAGASIERQLDSVNGAALKPAKREIGSFWNSLTAGSAAGGNARSAAAAPALNGGVKKIWLDGLMQPLLDRSVPQIGTPAAWAAGYTGKNVVVAVIDTGADALHPDLAGKILDARDFVGDGDDNDKVGHGTHVAATIAGSGAASSGLYRGVAPDAQLVVGKVCVTRGCPTTAIIAGMEWAVIEKQVKLINMSLGGLDELGIDPMEEAVNRLTAEHGALFIVAAGNEGPAPATIGSPASADAALAVGAVDRLDQMAFFSSRGPRNWDKALKPEITAPGVGIVAARGSDTELGEPVGNLHVVLSGTSMATPHVAGAAALLKQRYPNWTPAQLKAALMGSAKFNPATSVFDQGAGRVDVAAAFSASAVASPSSLSLGTALWPHEDDEVVTRVVTYSGVGTAATTLNVRLEIIGPDGKAPPAGMFTVNPVVLSIPAGGTAATTLTVNTRLPGADGLYSGRLIGVADGKTVSTPVAIEREEESYDLVLRHIDRQGAMASSYRTVFVPLDREINPIPSVVGSVAQDVRVRLPPGRYAVESTVLSLPGETETLTLLMKPLHDVSAPGSLTLDAREARAVTLKSPTPTAQALLTHIGWEQPVSWGRFQVDVGSGGDEGDSVIYTAHLGSPSKGFTSFVSGQWKEARNKSDSAQQPQFYAQTWVQQEVFPTGLVKAVRPENMAVVKAKYAASPSSATQALAIVSPDVKGRALLLGAPVLVTLPYRRTEYYGTEEGAPWISQLRVEMQVDESSSFHINTLISAPTQYQARRHYSSRWNEAPFGPFFTKDPMARWAVRIGNSIAADIPLFGDRERHSGVATLSSGRLALYRNGQRIGEFPFPQGRFDVEPERATYRLEAEAIQEVLSLSSRVSAAWTFDSSQVGDDSSVDLPLLTVRFEPPLDAKNQAVAGTRIQMPISVWRNGRSRAVKARDLKVEVSFDDGASWNTAPLKNVDDKKSADDNWVAVIKHPAQSKYVSLRATAADDSGNRVEETLIRAYALTDGSKPAQ